MWEWQIWIQDGDRPIPRKYVITSKWITAAPATAASIAVCSSVTSLACGCSSVVVNGLTYYNCGGTFYQPVYDGPSVGICGCE